jgi:hypothetical protein
VKLCTDAADRRRRTTPADQNSLMTSTPVPDPALLLARAALAAQSAALAHAVVRLESARQQLPGTGPGPHWRGVAQAAYRSSVADLAQRFDEATAAVRSAHRLSADSLAALDSRVG